MRRFIKDVVLPVAVAVALAFVIQASVAKPYAIPTESMVPTIEADDRIIANRIIYRVRDIERGDIIVFNPTESATQACRGQGNIPFVKRVIGLGGDEVEVRGGATYVNGEEFVVEGEITPSYEMRWERVPEDHLIVLGDNRASSCDSHEWDNPFVPVDAVIGQAEVTYWPPTHVKFLD